MKKIKKVQSLLLTLLLLSFSVFANFIYVSADTDDEIVTDESVVEPMDSFEGFESNVFEYPTVDENYISYLSKPSMTRTVATSSLQMSQGGIVDYADIVKSDGSKANISLKYVVNDGSGDMVDSSGNAKWRMVYCLEYKKNYPQGTNTYDGGASLSKYIVYCLTYGVQYWGETSTYTPYSTGDWKKDYAVTQYAIHALNLEFVPGGSYEQNRDWILSHITYSDVKKKTAQLINDALNDGNYKGFSGNNYTGYKYFLSPSTQSEWSAYTYNGQSGYITNNWYTQDFRDTIYTSKSKPWYIKYVSSSVSGVDGAKIVWENSKSWSGFKIWVPKAAYEAAQINGATVSVSLTNQIPGYLSAWRYNPSDTSFQVSTLYEAGSYSSQTNKVTATIEKVVPKTGSICLTKSSMEPEFTDNNSLYSLQDAVYTVYEKGTSIEVGTIITDFQGKGSLEGLTLGEYDIKETTAPEGFVLDTNVYSVTLSETDSASVSIDVADTPQMAPITVLLQKTDAETGKTSPQGTAVLSGAEFVVKYYDVLSGTEDPAITDNIPVRTWIFQTDDNGLIQYDSSFLISGDDLYITAAGIPAIPLGTIVIQETKAPEGYLLNDEIVIIPIDSNTTSENTISYAVPTISENILSIKLKKIQSGTEKVIPGAIFEHTRPNGEVEFSTTDENGELTFNGLEWGEHRIKEISVSEGYSVNTNEIKFSVNEQNKITIHSELVETDTDGKITITVNDEGKIEAAVEDKPLPYSFHGIKMNDKGLIIEGAEFTMYSDRECTDVIDRRITDNEGVFIMDNMIPGKYYYLKETKAPQGYRLPESRNLIEIYVESIPVEGVFDFYINGTKYTEKDTDTTREIYLGGTNADRVIYINVVNKTGLLLPETGSCMTILLIFTGVILATSGLIHSKYKGIIGSVK